MVRCYQEVVSQTDYLLATNCRMFSDIAFRDPHHNRNHYILLVCLHI